jgi:hypothetical protein
MINSGKSQLLVANTDTSGAGPADDHPRRWYSKNPSWVLGKLWVPIFSALCTSVSAVVCEQRRPQSVHKVSCWRVWYFLQSCSCFWFSGGRSALNSGSCWGISARETYVILEKSTSCVGHLSKVLRWKSSLLLLCCWLSCAPFGAPFPWWLARLLALRVRHSPMLSWSALEELPRWSASGWGPIRLALIRTLSIWS